MTCAVARRAMRNHLATFAIFTACGIVYELLCLTQTRALRADKVKEWLGCLAGAQAQKSSCSAASAWTGTMPNALNYMVSCGS